MRRSLAAALWLLAAAGAYAMVISWADDAQTGKLQPWVLIVVFWAAAAVSVAIHHLSRYLTGQLAQLPEALRRSPHHPARARHLVSLSQRYLARGLERFERLGAHFAQRREALSRMWPHLTLGQDPLTRAWRQHRRTAGAPTTPHRVRWSRSALSTGRPARPPEYGAPAAVLPRQPPLTTATKPLSGARRIPRVLSP
ncbi:MAG: hypothetical protein J2P50_16420 [Hyphomicrobiaceae bacterium]|nr:hypothetical protein [Hyphomicrobiaceae bacterium]